MFRINGRFNDNINQCDGEILRKDVKDTERRGDS